jgi:hypothetical protein
MVYLYLALGLLMSISSTLQGASGSDSAEADSAMLARMAAKVATLPYSVSSADPIEQLIAQNSQRTHEQYSPQRAVQAQNKFNAQLPQRTISCVPFYVPVACVSSELQQCFRKAYISVPSDKPLSHKTIMMLTPDATGNTLETIMIASANKTLLEEATLTTVLWALEMLAMGEGKRPLIYSLVAATKLICDGMPSSSWHVGDIQGCACEFTSESAPAEPVLLAQGLLATYFEFKQSNLPRYVDALDYFARDFAPYDVPCHGITPVLIPDVKRLQAYLARTGIPAAVIVDNKELTDPNAILAATLPEFITAPDDVAISQKMKLKNYLAELPGIGYIEE